MTTIAPPSREKAGEFDVQIAWVNARPDAGRLKEVSRLIDEGKLKTHVETVLPLSRVKEAHELSKAGRTRGKIVLRVAE